MTNRRFRINTPLVTHEIIDGEAVIINLESGSYYSLVDVGATVWGLIYQRTPLNEIINSIADTHEGDLAEIEPAVKELVQQLEAENLVVPEESETPLAQFTTLPNKNGHEKVPFRAPVLQKFTDMQELLLLDPIHDVDDMGWPKPNPELGK